MQLPEYPEKDASLCAEELEGLNEVIYVRPDDGATYSLNLTAASILEWCDGKRNSMDITRLLADALPENERPEISRISADVDAILIHFAEHGLIYAASDEGTRA